ncbi:MAG: nuclear transport factor 2 family protein [Flavobacteriales bacterium]|nr:nuclear transport factor 2 family protein [Flavobacteriales bacterium]
MEVFQAFGQGLMSGTDSWKEVVAENVSFTGPVDQIEGIEAFAKLNESFAPMMRGMEMNQAIEAGDFVMTQVELDVAMPSGNTIKLDMSEWYEIKEGKIQSVKVYYDAEEFRKELKTA